MEIHAGGGRIPPFPEGVRPWAGHLRGPEHAERHLGLCIDDSVLATGGSVREALARLRASGRRSLVVSRRPLPELMSELAGLRHVLDGVVGEAGAVLWLPGTGDIEQLDMTMPAAVRHACSVLGVPRGRMVGVGASERCLVPLHECGVVVATADADETMLAHAGLVTEAAGTAAILEIVVALVIADAGGRRPAAPPLLDLVSVGGDRRRGPRGRVALS